MGRIKIGEAVTDRNGKARFLYDIMNVHEDFAIEAVYDEYSKRKSIDNVTYTILLETDMFVDTGDPIEISGYLLEDDLPMNQEQLNVFLDDVRVKTVLVNSQDGSYSATLDDVADGTHSVYVTWNNNKVSSSVETVYVGTPVYELSLSCSTPMIMVDDTAVVVASLTKDSFAFAGETLTYQIKHDSTVIDSGSAVTDSNGEISITYTGTGVGDVDVIVTYNNQTFLEKTYELTDYYYYDSQTTDKGRYSVTIGTANLSYSNNGFKCIGTASIDTFVENTALTLPTNYEAEFTVTEKFGSHYGGICLDDLLINFGGSDVTFYRLSTISNLGSSPVVLTAGDVFKVVMQSNTMQLYRNGTLLKTFNNISNTGVYQHRIYVDRGHTVKDLKIKAL